MTPGTQAQVTEVDSMSHAILLLHAGWGRWVSRRRLPGQGLALQLHVVALMLPCALTEAAPSCSLLLLWWPPGSP